MSVLIVEDHLVTQRIIETALEKHGYSTITSKNGKEAFEKLTLMDDIDLVITDILMPELDGLKLIQLIKQNEDWKDIPIIISTSLADTATVKKAVSMGIKHYIVKPIDKTQLLAKVREALAVSPSGSKTGNSLDLAVDETEFLDDVPGMTNSTNHSNLDIDFEFDNEKKSAPVKEAPKNQEPTKKQIAPTARDVIKLLSSAAPLGSAKVLKLLHNLVSVLDKLDTTIIESEQAAVEEELKEKLKQFDKI